MIRFALLLATQATAASGPAMPPIDWSGLAPLPYRIVPEVTPAMSQFVATAARSGTCPIGDVSDGRAQLRTELAILVDRDLVVRRIVPRAIDCPIVEQYSAGLVSRFTRDNLTLRHLDRPRWYRTSLTFSWTP